MRMAWVSRLLILIVLLPVLGGITINQMVKTELRQEFHRQFNGFRELELVEFSNLVASHTEVPIPLTVSKDKEAGSLELHFSLSEESAVYLSASADSAEEVLVHPLILQRGDGERLLLPLLRSSIAERSVWSSIRLGRFAAGDHTVVLTADEALSLPIPESIQFRATRPSYDSLLSVFIDHHPTIAVKNPENVLDDIPLMGYSHVYQRNAEYKVTSHLIFSSENGGTKPPGLMNSYQRTLDIEWVMKQIFEWNDGQLVASYRQFQAKNHTPQEYEGRRMQGNSPVLTVATPNNNFGDGRSWLGFLIPEDASAEDKSLIYAPKPIYLPPGHWSQHLIDAYPEMQQWSQIELAKEGCIDISNEDDPATQEFKARFDWVDQYLTVEFPDRGCGTKRVQPLPYEPG